MNIYDFFHSPDIAEHCRKIEHVFKPLDMAIIVAISDKPIKEKLAAYKAIITEYPDIPIHESLNFKAKPSLHEYLRELIERKGKSLEDELNMIFFHLPIPFEKGDLVMTEEEKPFVLDWLPHWGTGNKFTYEDYVAGKNGDGSDMIANCYHINQGRLERDYVHNGVYCLRYFTGELKGQEKFLKYLSQYIKTKDDSIDWLIAVYCKFKSEAEHENWNELFGSGWFRSLEEEEP
jgi:hypothetical protein